MRSRYLKFNCFRRDEMGVVYGQTHSHFLFSIIFHVFFYIYYSTVLHCLICLTNSSMETTSEAILFPGVLTKETLPFSLARNKPKNRVVQLTYQVYHNFISIVCATVRPGELKKKNLQKHKMDSTKCERFFRRHVN